MGLQGRTIDATHLCRFTLAKRLQSSRNAYHSDSRRNGVLRIFGVGLEGGLGHDAPKNLGIQPSVIITKSCRTCKKQSPGMRVVSHRLLFNGAFFSVVRVELGFRESRAYPAGKKQMSRRRMRMRHFVRWVL